MAGANMSANVIAFSQENLCFRSNHGHISRGRRAAESLITYSFHSGIRRRRLQYQQAPLPFAPSALAAKSHTAPART
jgi:hypothetical protein